MRCFAKRLSDSSLDPVSLHCRSDLACDNYPQSRSCFRRESIIHLSLQRVFRSRDSVSRPREYMQRKTASFPRHTFTEHTNKLRLLLESHRGREPRVTVSCHSRTIVGSAVRFKLCSVSSAGETSWVTLYIQPWNHDMCSPFLN